jgi:hypothetical protein
MANKHTARVQREFMFINGHRVEIAEYRTNKAGERMGLEPSHGYYEEVQTPWGAVERCYIVTVPSLSGDKQRYASVYKPVTNPNVQWSVFEVFG